ncbi:hypothetical protein MPTK2_3g11920 [Marchantia polymorpha subsp. ruderalis]
MGRNASFDPTLFPTLLYHMYYALLLLGTYMDSSFFCFVYLILYSVFLSYHRSQLFFPCTISSNVEKEKHLHPS